jgi:hypothetical protein
MEITSNRDLVFVCFNNAASIDESVRATNRMLRMNYGSERSGMVGFHNQLFLTSLEPLFRSFISLERISCLFAGRPMSLHAEECEFFCPDLLLLLTVGSYDVELPLEVDDAYWDQEFTQPPGRPSQLSYFVCHLRLCEVIIQTPYTSMPTEPGI